MSNGCCGARLLAISYVADESSPCEFDNHALDYFLNGFFGGVNSNIFMEVSLVKMYQLFLLFIGGVLLNVSIIGGLIWLAIYLFHHYFGG